MTVIATADRLAPWYVMGAGLTAQGTTVAEVLAAAGMDYTVRTQPLLSLQADGSTLAAPGLRTIVRPTAEGDRVLAACGTRYTPIQNAEAFAVADVLVAEHGATIESAADFKSGGSSLLVVDLKRPVNLRTPRGTTDTTNLNLLVRNAHDGSAAVTFALTGMRLACTNAVQAAIGKAERVWRYSHTPNAGARVEAATHAIIAALAYQDALQDQAQAMMDTRMVDAEFAKIVAGLFPITEGTSDRVAEKREEQRQEVLGIYHGSAGTEDVRGSLWGGYNAITEWYQWGRKTTDEVSRAEGALVGAAVAKQDAVWRRFAAAAA